ncbi:hypothetical protein D3C80_1621890 [compost metagenome]
MTDFIRNAVWAVGRAGGFGNEYKAMVFTIKAFVDDVGAIYFDVVVYFIQEHASNRYFSCLESAAFQRDELQARIFHSHCLIEAFNL